MRLFPVVLFMCIILVACGRSEEYDVSYVPLEMNFYVAKSPESLKRNVTVTGLKSRAFDSLFARCEEAGVSPSISDEFLLIRVLIKRVSDGKEIYISQNKIALSSDGRQYLVKHKYVISALNSIERTEEVKAILEEMEQYK